MIDIWMIFAMIYPFCVVSLYSALEYLKAHDRDIPVALKIKKTKWKITKAIRVVNLMLDFVLPIIVIIFIIMFLQHLYDSMGADYKLKG